MFSYTSTTTQPTPEELEECLQRAKSVLIKHLYKKEVLTEEQYKSYMNEYALIVKKPSFFKRLVSKISPDKEEAEEYQIVLVKREE
jgi:hypothetical protein